MSDADERIKDSLANALRLCGEIRAIAESQTKTAHEITEIARKAMNELDPKGPVRVMHLAVPAQWCAYCRDCDKLFAGEGYTTCPGCGVPAT